MGRDRRRGSAHAASLPRRPEGGRLLRAPRLGALGRDARAVEAVGAAPAGVDAAIRRMQPLAELRTPFELSRRELEAIDRGSRDYDLQVVIDAARQAASAEDAAVFHGYDAAGISGISESTPHEPVVISDDYNQYPGTVARAVATLQNAASGDRSRLRCLALLHTGVIETTEHGGYPVLEHIRLILGGPIVWAPAVDAAIVVSLRGGDHQPHVRTGLLDRLHRPRRRQRAPVPGREHDVPRSAPMRAALRLFPTDAPMWRRLVRIGIYVLIVHRIADPRHDQGQPVLHERRVRPVDRRDRRSDRRDPGVRCARGAPPPVGVTRAPRVALLDRVEDVGADRQRSAAVVLLAHAVEARRRCLMAAGAVAAEAVDDVGRPPLLDRRPRAGDREEEEFPVTCRGLKPFSRFTIASCGTS